MVIKCILSGSMESIIDSAKQYGELPTLPEHISKNGPYVDHDQGADHQIIISYEFDRSRLREAWEKILQQMDTLQIGAGVNISFHIFEKSLKLNPFRELPKASAPAGNDFSPHL